MVIGRGEQGLPIFYQFTDKCRFEVSFADRRFFLGGAIPSTTSLHDGPGGANRECMLDLLITHIFALIVLVEICALICSCFSASMIHILV